MIEFGRGVAVLCAVVAMVVVVPAGAVEPGRTGCEWTAELLPLPDNAFAGRVTGGDGAWLTGVIDDQGVLWRDGRLVMVGRAFESETELRAVNAAGVAVGSVIGADGRQHAIRYANGYEYLPASGSSVALDVNARGETLGYDGSALVVWPVRGPARILAMPTGSAAFGQAAIDDDGTVVARTGHVEGGRLRLSGNEWAPDGTRAPVAVGDVRDLRDGHVVGVAGDEMFAMGWDLHGKPARVYRGGVSAAAINRDGVVVGAGPVGEPLVWSRLAALPLPSPAGYAPGSVTAVNDRDAGGFVSPVDDIGAAPVRWTCR
jgi:hypothetical protein